MTPLPDFDTLRWMADNKPDALERLRNRLNREFIASSTGNKAQLECLLFNLEQQLSRCTNPVQRCVLAMGMVRRKLQTLQAFLDEPGLVCNKGTNVVPLFKR